MQNDISQINKINERILSEVRALAALLTPRGLHVTAAESLTGGMLCSSFVDVPGSSDWFSYGFVTYSNEAKEHILGVDKALIDAQTAVCADVALEMARSALRISSADFAAAVTGLAGPFFDEDGNPYPLAPEHEPGLVFIACASRGGAVVKRCVFTGSRTLIRKQTVFTAVRLLKKLVQSGI